MKKSMKKEYLYTQYDEVAKARYIVFSRKKVSKTVEASPQCLIDVARDGSVVGIELLGTSARTRTDDIVNLVIPKMAGVA